MRRWTGHGKTNDGQPERHNDGR